MTPAERQIKFLEKSLEIVYQLRAAYDTKANFLLGVGLALFLLSLARYENTAFFILAIFSLITVIMCIYSISLPYRRNSPEAKESLFCWWSLKGKTYQDYLASIKKEIKDDDDLVEAYSLEIYSLYRNSLRYKLTLLRLAASSLLIGFVVELIYLLT